MPSSYTPSLRLILPVTGELQGTWGDTVNQGLTQLVEAAIAGTATVAMPDADVTLSTANEAPDQARNMVIRLTGALLAQRSVICPSVSKIYFVFNETTGNQNILFRTAAGTGVTIPPGRSMLLYCDGTNVLNAVSRLVADLVGNVSGNVSGNAGSVTNGVYTTGNQNIDGAKTFLQLIQGSVSGNAGSVTNGVYTNTAQTLTGVKRGAITTDNDLAFDLSAANNFQCTTAGNGTLTFTGIAAAAGQSGFIELINAANHTISKAATTRTDANFLATVSQTGTYLVSYFCDGTNVFCVTSGALT